MNEMNVKLYVTAKWLDFAVTSNTICHMDHSLSPVRVPSSTLSSLVEDSHQCFSRDLVLLDSLFPHFRMPSPLVHSIFSLHFSSSFCISIVSTRVAHIPRNKIFHACSQQL